MTAMTRPEYDAVASMLQTLGADGLETDDIGVYAIELTLRGWRVFPLHGKVPAIPTAHRPGDPLRGKCKGECGRDGHGVLDATTDLGQIKTWWSGRYRGCNIGAQVPTNMFVIDVDPRNGGAKSLAELVAKFGPLPQTLTTISGRGDGGSHRFYRRPFGKLTSKHLGPGIDVKTSAGYVVVAPSIHPDSDQPYRWIEGPVVDPPPWLVDLMRPPVPVVRNTKEHESTKERFSGPSIADTFTESVSWAQVLEPHGWRCLDPDCNANGARWLHPAATSACSATVRHGCLFVYSPNTPFEITEAGDAHGYTRFRAHAILNHAGDLSAAARALRLEGVF
jgi:Bifunctional DNA primase/polymerase, N-terminal